MITAYSQPNYISDKKQRETVKVLNNESVAKTIRCTGAQAVIKSLHQEKVSVIFGYPGGQNMPIYDALYDYTRTKKITHILTRHEQGAIHAAEGYAKASGKVGVCFATSGPGATNVITGLANALMDSTPIVCITGQVPTALIGTQAFQEVNIVDISKSVTKWNHQITNPDEIGDVITKAFTIAASGRPGPVLIDIPKDMQFGACAFQYKKSRKAAPPALPITKIKSAAQLLNNAKRPMIIIGNGVRIAGAEDEVCKLVGRSGIPIASTLHGLSSYKYGKELYVGLLGMHGNYAPNKLTNKADVILAVGMRFADRVTGNPHTYGKNAKIVHIDISASELNKIVQTEIAINADAKDALKELNNYIQRNEHKKWLTQFKKLEKEEMKQVIKPEVFPQEGEIRMAEVIHMLAKKTHGNALIVADVGQHQMIAARYYTHQKTNSFITSGGLGTMGFALPAAIGAKEAQPTREVIAIMGDGSAQMNIQELGTIMQEKLPVKIIILNNSHLGLVRQWQEMFFEKRYSCVDLINPEFTQIAKAYNIPGEKVTDRKNLESALEKFIRSTSAYLLEITVKQEEKVFPMVPGGASIDDIRLT